MSAWSSPALVSSISSIAFVELDCVAADCDPESSSSPPHATSSDVLRIAATAIALPKWIVLRISLAFN